MTTISDRPLKLCCDCKVVKPLSGGYYKAGNSYQKRCKNCHNVKRSQYNNTSNYVKKPTGFKKLDSELQKKIMYDIYVRINFKDIALKYPEVKHQTLLLWNRKNLIPKYVEPV